MESLIFDVDGTLWDAVALVAEGWNDGLQSMGFAPHCTEQSIRPLFGKTMTEIAQVVVPGVPQEQAMEVMDRCMDGEMARLRRDPCHIFYPGVKETLTELHKTHRLFIVISGIQLITKEEMTPRNLTIVSVALGVGYGMGANMSILAQAPQAIQLIFGGSGIVPAAFVAIILNILLPKDK